MKNYTSILIFSFYKDANSNHNFISYTEW